MSGLVVCTGAIGHADLQRIEHVATTGPEGTVRSHWQVSGTRGGKVVLAWELKSANSAGGHHHLTRESRRDSVLHAYASQASQPRLPQQSKTSSSHHAVRTAQT